MTPSMPQETVVYTCSRCNRAVSAGADRCPHCKASFDYTQHPDGTRIYNPGHRRGFGIGGGAIWGGAIAAVIALLVRLFKGSR